MITNISSHHQTFWFELNEKYLTNPKSLHTMVWSTLSSQNLRSQSIARRRIRNRRTMYVFFTWMYKPCPLRKMITGRVGSGVMNGLFGKVLRIYTRKKNISLECSMVLMSSPLKHTTTHHVDFTHVIDFFYTNLCTLISTYLNEYCLYFRKSRWIWW